MLLMEKDARASKARLDQSQLGGEVFLSTESARAGSRWATRIGRNVPNCFLSRPLTETENHPYKVTPHKILVFNLLRQARNVQFHSVWT